MSRRCTAVPVAPPGGGKNTNSRFLRFFVRSVPLFRSLMLTPMIIHVFTCISGSFPTIQYVTPNPPPSTMTLGYRGAIFLASYVHSHADGSAYVCQICSQSVQLFGIFPIFFEFVTPNTLQMSLGARGVNFV